MVDLLLDHNLTFILKHIIIIAHNKTAPNEDISINIITQILLDDLLSHAEFENKKDICSRKEESGLSQQQTECFFVAGY